MSAYGTTRIIEYVPYRTNRVTSIARWNLTRLTAVHVLSVAFWKCYEALSTSSYAACQILPPRSRLFTSGHALDSQASYSSLALIDGDSRETMHKHCNQNSKPNSIIYRRCNGCTAIVTDTLARSASTSLLARLICSAGGMGPPDNMWVPSTHDDHLNASFPALGLCIGTTYCPLQRVSTPWGPTTFGPQLVKFGTG